MGGIACSPAVQFGEGLASRCKPDTKYPINRAKRTLLCSQTAYGQAAPPTVPGTPRQQGAGSCPPRELPEVRRSAGDLLASGVEADGPAGQLPGRTLPRL